VVSERLKLLNQQDGLFYIADVPQNQQPVYYRASEITQEKFVFENPEHDFPKRIIYFVPHNDTLRARIEGGSWHKNFIYVRQISKK
jgi:hypothetical protein